jgi:hypothetical protein
MQANLTLRMTGPLVAATLLAFPTLAMAHGPSRQKLIESVEINAPAEKVWAKIGNFQDMSWHPAVEKTEFRAATKRAPRGS